MHLDFDVANLHRIYPLVELNWYHYNRSGKARDLNFEGADLVNFGSSVGFVRAGVLPVGDAESVHPAGAASPPGTYPAKS